MRIKTFEAPTMHEALLLAKNELGDNAVVLNTKHVKAAGMLGIGAGERVELMAAVDDAPAGVSAFAAAAAAPARSAPIAVQREEPVTAPAVAAVAQVSEPAMVGAAPIAAKAYSQAPSAPQSDAQLKQLWNEVFRLTSVVEGLSSTRTAPETTTATRSLAVRLGIHPEIATRVMPDVGNAADAQSLQNALAVSMRQHSAALRIEHREVIALVGPTGVGKTTTLAKLAAKFALEQEKKVALITADTFRIGAVEQLRTYARIMGVPVEIALSPEEIAAAVSRHADKDVILIDTVGRSQRSTESLAELKTFVDAACPTQIHLVVSASSASNVQKDVLEKFAIFGPSRLIITKIDEAPLRGCLVNLPVRSGIPISCVTAGQNVPHDIEFADAALLAGLVAEVA
jgi:flagellar biosynthesis protein FlhF